MRVPPARAGLDDLLRRGVGMLAMSALLSGCLAQQADLVQVRQDLDAKIERLDQREQDIQKAIDRANQQIAQQKKEVDQLVSETRARLKYEITELREQDLPKIKGKLDEQAHALRGLGARLDDVTARTARQEQAAKEQRGQIDARLATLEKLQQDQLLTIKSERDRTQAELDKLRKRLETVSATVLAGVKTIESRLDVQQKAIAEGEARSTSAARQLVEEQGKAVTEQVAQFSRALGEFKQALGKVSEELARDQQHISEVTAEVTRRNEALTAKIETDAKSTSAHLAEVNKSVGSVAKALENTGSTLASRQDEQDHRLAEIVAATTALHVAETALRNRLEEQEQHLEELRQEVRGSSTRVQKSQKAGVATERAAEGGGTGKGIESASTGARQRGEAAAATVAAIPGTDRAAEEAYGRALRLLQAGDLDAATEEFSAFLVQYPNASLAPNAQYWLGECRYAKQEYRQAIEAFEHVERTYPRSEKASAALLKAGYSYLALSDQRSASEALKRVVAAYPKSPEAAKAREKLSQMNATP